MRPARSSTATCFCTAAKLISYRAARSDTDGVSVSDRAKMSRRVPSAKARKSWLSDSSLSFRSTTMWLYVSLVRSLSQGNSEEHPPIQVGAETLERLPHQVHSALPMMGVPTPPIGKTSTCLTPPSPALTTFCRLEELGLEVTGQRLEPDRAVLACRVVELDGWCRRCGCEGTARDTVVRRLA